MAVVNSSDIKIATSAFPNLLGYCGERKGDEEREEN